MNWWITWTAASKVLQNSYLLPSHFKMKVECSLNYHQPCGKQNLATAHTVSYLVKQRLCLVIYIKLWIEGVDVVQWLEHATPLLRFKSLQSQYHLPSFTLYYSTKLFLRGRELLLRIYLLGWHSLWILQTRCMKMKINDKFLTTCTIIKKWQVFIWHLYNNTEFY